MMYPSFVGDRWAAGAVLAVDRGNAVRPRDDASVGRHDDARDGAVRRHGDAGGRHPAGDGATHRHGQLNGFP